MAIAVGAVCVTLVNVVVTTPWFPKLVSTVPVAVRRDKRQLFVADPSVCEIVTMAPSAWIAMSGNTLDSDHA